MVSGGARILISGANRLGTAIEERLRAGGATVARLSEDPSALTAAALEGVAALVLASGDDAGNVDMALIARRLRPDLPLVIRLFDPELAAYVRATLKGAAILSMSSVAAPVLARETLRALGRAAVQRRGVPRARCGGAGGCGRPGGGGSIACCGRGADAGRRGRDGDGVLHEDAGVARARRRLLRLDDGHDGRLRRHHAAQRARQREGGRHGVDAGGGGVPGGAVRVLHELGDDASGKDALKGLVQVRWKDHVVLAGGGHMGIGVADLLAAAGRRIVVIEREEDRPHIEMLRAAGHRVIIADATKAEILELAGVKRAAALVALTDADPTNLHIALLARAQRADLAIVMRAESAELSAYVNEHKDAVAVSSVAVTADEFARNALAAVRGPRLVDAAADA